MFKLKSDADKKDQNNSASHRPLRLVDEIYSQVLEGNLTDVEHAGQTYPAGAVCEGKVLICETRQLVCITSTMNKNHIH